MTADGDFDSLLANARTKGPRALLAFGKRLLVGEGVPASPGRALDVLREAAAGGSGEAANLLAVCAAWGVGGRRDVHKALDYLHRAAGLGARQAHEELELLARASTPDASLLRERIDLRELTTPPPARFVRQRPRIAVFERFLSVAECEWLIRRGGPHLTRAQVYRGSPLAETAETRTNREASFTIFNADVVQSLIRDRIAAATGAQTSCFEVAKILHYEPGQRFALHGDFIQPKTPALMREVELRGQRAATFLVYLNEGYEGGETEFPTLGFRFKGARGDALWFTNVDDAGAPDYDTVHAGLPPTRGEKWVLSQWIRTRPVAAT